MASSETKRPAACLAAAAKGIPSPHVSSAKDSTSFDPFHLPIPLPLIVLGVAIAVVASSGWVGEGSVQTIWLMLITGIGMFLLENYSKNKAIAEMQQATLDAIDATDSIMKTSLDAVVSMNEAGEICGWNLPSEKMFGWKREEVMGKQMSEVVIPHKYRELHHKGLKKFLASGQGPVLGARIEIEAINRKEECFAIEMAIISTNTPTGFVFHAWLRDISERKKKLSALEDAKASAEKFAKVQSMFVANMSHEIRTPMNGVLALISLLLDTKLSAEQVDLVSTMRSCGEALMSVINDVLDFSRIQDNMMTVEDIVFRPSDTLVGCVDIVKSEAQQKGLKVSWEIDESFPEIIVSDKRRLRQIIVNLLQNAVKFTESGSIDISVEKWSANQNLKQAKALLEDSKDDGLISQSDVKQTGDSNSFYMHVQVNDTGIGMEPDQLHKLFQAFSQLDDSATRRYGGSGLGLAISKRLVDLLHGQIWVTSQVGIGSSFNFTVLVKEAAKGSITSPPMLSRLHSPTNVRGKPILLASKFPLKILIAEDNKVNLKVLRKLLKSKLGYTADFVTDGKQALEKLRERDYDVVLMDVHMPVMDGLASTRAIRAEISQEKQPYIVAVTASVFREERTSCKMAGMDDYVSKPVSYGTIAAALTRSSSKKKHHNSSSKHKVSSNLLSDLNLDLPDVLPANQLDIDAAEADQAQ